MQWPQKRANAPEEYVSERSAEHRFDLWKYSIAKDRPNKRSTDQAHGVGQRNSCSRTLALMLP
jgi:hypothetical protein